MREEPRLPVWNDEEWSHTRERASERASERESERERAMATGESRAQRVIEDVRTEVAAYTRQAQDIAIRANRLRSYLSRNRAAILNC